MKLERGCEGRGVKNTKALKAEASCLHGKEDMSQAHGRRKGRAVCYRTKCSKLGKKTPQLDECRLFT